LGGGVVGGGGGRKGGLKGKKNNGGEKRHREPTEGGISKEKGGNISPGEIGPETWEFGGTKRQNRGGDGKGG